MKQVVDKWRKAIRKANTITIFKRVIVENQEEILDFNVAQLRKGKDSFGNFLYDYVSDDYARFKQSIGSQAPFGKPDLILEGDFTEGFVLKYGNGGEFNITSTDDKTADLVAKYGNDIFGLANESLNEIRPYLLESFIKLFRNELL